MAHLNIPDCKDFTGYKPCHPGDEGETCISPVPRGTKILIVNIGALGAVLMTTTILPAVKRKYPESTIYWLTSPRAQGLLQNNPYIDKIIPFDDKSILVLQAMQFDLVFNTDKISGICALINLLNAKKKLGFGLNEDGVIIPLNEGSEYNYRLGLDNELKFKKNKISYPAMLREMGELDSSPDEYVFEFTQEEHDFIDDLKNENDLKKEHPTVGINTGSSPDFQLKRIPEAKIEETIHKLYEKSGGNKVLLLGGLEDEERNEKLSKKLADKVLNTPTTEGLRKGLSYVDLCDVVITSDSLGMHMAIARKKIVIAWFNVTCAPEIELYGRGEKIISKVECSPCWKQVCDKGLVCHEEDISGEIIRTYDKLYS